MKGMRPNTLTIPAGLIRPMSLAVADLVKYTSKANLDGNGLPPSLFGLIPIVTSASDRLGVMYIYYPEPAEPPAPARPPTDPLGEAAHEYRDALRAVDPLRAAYEALRYPQGRMDWDALTTAQEAYEEASDRVSSAQRCLLRAARRHP